MIPFLYNVAQAYYKAHPNTISKFTFVFPNRRAAVFFQHYLSLIAKKPIFSPEVLTISDLFERLSDYKKADRIEMLFLLYEIYKRISKTNETFDEFLYWGEMLLNDFDDIDKYLADAKQLFSNIQDLKEIEAGFEFLTLEQIEAIRRFWSNFIPIGENEKKKDFLEMWMVLHELYSTFKKELSEKGLAYEGMIFREVVDKTKKDTNIELAFEKVIFVGLNGHSKSEEAFLKYLKKKEIADFYWDYSSPLVKDPQNKASFFIDKNRAQFPSTYQLEPEEIPMELPIIESIGIPSSIGQAKYVYSILKNLLDEKKIESSEQAMSTALILPDENILIPTLYSIPNEIDKINVTMGYNLANSSISGFIEYILDLQKSTRKVDGQMGFYFRPVIAILNHRYVQTIAKEDAKVLLKEIIKNNKTTVFIDEFKKNNILAEIFIIIESWNEVPLYLQKLLTILQQQLFVQSSDARENKINRSADIEGEFIIEYYKAINKMGEAMKSFSPEMTKETYFKLLKKLVAGISVPFSGEPLSGLQVMGVLETRALDFDNIIILSMNEGTFPLKRPASSFIPYNLRKGFDLPTYEHQDSIYAYHFYRMINRAKRIYLLHDTRTEGFQSGEVSRYYKQLKFLYKDKFDIREKIATYKVSSSENLTISIQKSPEIMDKLNMFLAGGSKPLSASSINMYLNCPLQFYFMVVEQMTEADEVAETIEASMFGTLFHTIMEWIYFRFEGKLVTADLLHKLSKDDIYLSELIEKAFAEKYFITTKIRKLTGQNFLTGEVLRRYVKQVLQMDAKSTPFLYIKSELTIKENYTIPSGKTVALKGIIDRVDEVKGHTRIIDYKTGKGDLRFRSMKDLFNKELKDRPKAVMQVFMYAYLYLITSPAKVVEPGIYYLRNLFNNQFDPDAINKSGREEVKIDNFNPLFDEFKEEFDACLDEIFNPELPFSQTTTGEACKWCTLTSICKK